MGGRRGVERSAGGERAKALGPVSTEDTDSHTIFVRSLPFSLTDSQLEDIFSEVGPVRHCFTIKEKGSDQHRGFGFVQFAVTEDAQRAVEEKNGALLQGRKIKVEIAKRRAPLDQRRPKPDPPNSESTISDQHKPSNLGGADAEPKKRKSSELQSTSPVQKKNTGQRETKKIKPDGQGGVKVQEVDGKNEEVVVPAPARSNEKKEIKQGNAKAGDKSLLDVKDGETKDEEQARGSSKQRPARTVVVGGLLNTEMFEAVLVVAKTVGPVESVKRTFSEYELNSRGLAKDGCKPRAAAIVFLSVKAAMQAVAALHTNSIGGGVVWARQLGGEGSKLKKWRLIVRNLPFQITETQLRELFSPSGFLWEVTIPRKLDGKTKGFAFVGFTNKSDADKAIKAVNGKSVGKRPVAVDWAVGKKEFETSVSTATTPVVLSDLEDSDTTANNESEDEEEDSEDDSEVPIEEKQSEDSKSTKSRALGEDADEKTHLDVKMLKKNKAAQESALEEEDNEEIKDTEKKTKKSKISTEEKDSQKLSTKEMEQHAHVENMGRSEEMDMVKRILNKVVLSTQNQAYASTISADDDEEAEELLSGGKSERPKEEAKQTKELNGKMSRSKKSEVPVDSDKDGDEKPISRTVFIRNLPPDAKVPELRKLFSDFGVVKSFRMVLHPVTLRPKGTAFLEYATKEAADSAIAAASTDGEAMNGLMIKGRQISVASAVERDTARDIAKDASKKQEQEDRRNLALAKEGYIQEGTPAAEGVSKKDLERRKMLEREKSTKLRSPNFHVSRTRLSMHNVPKGLTEKALKKLFLEAVKSRASKQHPVIKQVKILRDEVTGKARGTAFVEFTEHQHALVALRALNNNPATFTAESRPIVEFAVENSLILRKRAVQLEKHKRFQAVKNGEKVATADGKQKLIGKAGEGKKSRGDESKRIGGEQGEREEARTRSAGSKKKRKKGENTKVETGRVLEEQPSSTTVKTRREKQDVGSTLAKRGGRSKKKDKEGAEEAGQGGPTKLMDRQRAMKAVDRNRFTSNVAMQPVAKKQRRNEKGGLAKQLGGNKRDDVDDTNMRDNKRRRKLSRVDAAEDRLDQLVSEYRTKYFSVGPRSKSSKSNTKDGAATAGDLRRWFD